MPTNREVYFSLINKNNKYLTRLVVKSLLNDANGFVGMMELYKHFDEECLNYEKLMDNTQRVESGEPYQYVLGYASFIDRDFVVNKNVLIPRQETEELVISLRSMIERIYENERPVIADIGTGSGAIAVSLKRFIPNSDIIATDISQEALDVAVENATRQGLSIEFLKGNMVDPLLSLGIKLDVLVCNPPYIKDNSTIDEQVWKYEPHLALLADPDTKFYEEIFSHAEEIMKPNSFMVFEIGEEQEKPLMELIAKYFTFTNVTFRFAKDLYNKTRFLYIIMQEEQNYA